MVVPPPLPPPPQPKRASPIVRTIDRSLMKRAFPQVLPIIILLPYNNKIFIMFPGSKSELNMEPEVIFQGKAGENHILSRFSVRGGV
jgi:hypothetical protein